MFITNKGIKINADINGSLNILRKYIKKSSPNQEIAMDNGREQRPLKKNVAQQYVAISLKRTNTSRTSVWSDEVTFVLYINIYNDIL